MRGVPAAHESAEMRALFKAVKRMHDYADMKGEGTKSLNGRGNGRHRRLMDWVKLRVSEGRSDLLEAKEIIAFCRNQETKEAHPITAAFAVELACELLKTHQQVRSRR